MLAGIVYGIWPDYLLCRHSLLRYGLLGALCTNRCRLDHVYGIVVLTKYFKFSAVNRLVRNYFRRETNVVVIVVEAHPRRHIL